MSRPIRWHQPRTLAAHLAAVDDLKQAGGASDTTIELHQRWCRNFSKWATAIMVANGAEPPSDIHRLMTGDIVRAWLVQMAPGSRRVAAYAIRWATGQAGIADPTLHPKVVKLLKASDLQPRDGHRPRPLTPEELAKIWAVPMPAPSDREVARQGFVAMVAAMDLSLQHANKVLRRSSLEVLDDDHAIISGRRIEATGRRSCPVALLRAVEATADPSRTLLFPTGCLPSKLPLRHLMLGIDLPRGRIVASPDDLDRLVAAQHPALLRRWREDAALSLLLYGGYRASDIGQIAGRHAAINGEAAGIRLPSSKADQFGRGHTRMLTAQPQVIGGCPVIHLQQWVWIYQPADHDPLIPPSTSAAAWRQDRKPYAAPALRSALTTMLRRRAAAAGLDTHRISSHSGRRTVATIASATVPITDVKDHLGHAEVRTTGRYVQADTPPELTVEQ